MKILKTQKAQSTIILIVAAMILIMFLNEYMGAGKKPLFGFLKAPKNENS